MLQGPAPHGPARILQAIAPALPSWPCSWGRPRAHWAGAQTHDPAAVLASVVLYMCDQHMPICVISTCRATGGALGGVTVFYLAERRRPGTQISNLNWQERGPQGRLSPTMVRAHHRRASAPVLPCLLTASLCLAGLQAGNRGAIIHLLRRRRAPRRVFLAPSVRGPP